MIVMASTASRWLVTQIIAPYFQSRCGGRRDLLTEGVFVSYRVEPKRRQKSHDADYWRRCGQNVVVLRIDSARHCGLKSCCRVSDRNLAEGLGDVKLSPMRKRWRRLNFQQNFINLICGFYVSWLKHNDYGPVVGLCLAAGNKNGYCVPLKSHVVLAIFLSGGWLVATGSYMINTLDFTGANVGMVCNSKRVGSDYHAGHYRGSLLINGCALSEPICCHLVCAGALFVRHHYFPSDGDG